jgi:hypothetical protein
MFIFQVVRTQMQHEHEKISRGVVFRNNCRLVNEIENFGQKLRKNSFENSAV